MEKEICNSHTTSSIPVDYLKTIPASINGWLQSTSLWDSFVISPLREEYETQWLKEEKERRRAKGEAVLGGGKDGGDARGHRGSSSLFEPSRLMDSKGKNTTSANGHQQLIVSSSMRNGSFRSSSPANFDTATVANCSPMASLSTAGGGAMQSVLEQALTARGGSISVNVAQISSSLIVGSRSALHDADQTYAHHGSAPIGRRETRPESEEYVSACTPRRPGSSSLDITMNGGMTAEAMSKEDSMRGPPATGGEVGNANVGDGDLPSATTNKGRYGSFASESGSHSDSNIEEGDSSSNNNSEEKRKCSNAHSGLRSAEANGSEDQGAGNTSEQDNPLGVVSEKRKRHPSFLPPTADEEAELSPPQITNEQLIAMATPGHIEDLILAAVFAGPLMAEGLGVDWRSAGGVPTSSSTTSPNTNAIEEREGKGEKKQWSIFYSPPFTPEATTRTAVNALQTDENKPIRLALWHIIASALFDLGVEVNILGFKQILLGFGEALVEMLVLLFRLHNDPREGEGEGVTEGDHHKATHTLSDADLPVTPPSHCDPQMPTLSLGEDPTELAQIILSSAPPLSETLLASALSIEEYLRRLRVITAFKHHSAVHQNSRRPSLLENDENANDGQQEARCVKEGEEDDGDAFGAHLDRRGEGKEGETNLVSRQAAPLNSLLPTVPEGALDPSSVLLMPPPADAGAQDLRRRPSSCEPHLTAHQSQMVSAFGPSTTAAIGSPTLSKCEHNHLVLKELVKTAMPKWRRREADDAETLEIQTNQAVGGGEISEAKATHRGRVLSRETGKARVSMFSPNNMALDQRSSAMRINTNTNTNTNNNTLSSARSSRSSSVGGRAALLLSLSPNGRLIADEEADENALEADALDEENAVAAAARCKSSIGNFDEHEHGGDDGVDGLSPISRLRKSEDGLEPTRSTKEEGGDAAFLEQRLLDHQRSQQMNPLSGMYFDGRYSNFSVFRAVGSLIMEQLIDPTARFQCQFAAAVVLKDVCLTFGFAKVFYWLVLNPAKDIAITRMQDIIAGIVMDTNTNGDIHDFLLYWLVAVSSPDRLVPMVEKVFQPRLSTRELIEFSGMLLMVPVDSVRDAARWMTFLCASLLDPSMPHGDEAWVPADVASAQNRTQGLQHFSWRGAAKGDHVAQEYIPPPRSFLNATVGTTTRTVEGSSPSPNSRSYRWGANESHGGLPTPNTMYKHQLRRARDDILGTSGRADSQIGLSGVLHLASPDGGVHSPSAIRGSGSSSSPTPPPLSANEAAATASASSASAAYYSPHPYRGLSNESFFGGTVASAAEFSPLIPKGGESVHHESRRGSQQQRLIDSASMLAFRAHVSRDPELFAGALCLLLHIYRDYYEPPPKIEIISGLTNNGYTSKASEVKPRDLKNGNVAMKGSVAQLISVPPPPAGRDVADKGMVENGEGNLFPPTSPTARSSSPYPSSEVEENELSHLLEMTALDVVEFFRTDEGSGLTVSHPSVAMELLGAAFSAPNLFMGLLTDVVVSEGVFCDDDLRADVLEGVAAMMYTYPATDISELAESLLRQGFARRLACSERRPSGLLGEAECVFLQELSASPHLYHLEMEPQIEQIKRCEGHEKTVFDKSARAERAGSPASLKKPLRKEPPLAWGGTSNSTKKAQKEGAECTCATDIAVDFDPLKPLPLLKGAKHVTRLLAAVAASQLLEAVQQNASGVRSIVPLADFGDDDEAVDLSLMSARRHGQEGTRNGSQPGSPRGLPNIRKSDLSPRGKASPRHVKSLFPVENSSTSITPNPIPAHTSTITDEAVVGDSPIHDLQIVLRRTIGRYASDSQQTEWALALIASMLCNAPLDLWLSTHEDFVRSEQRKSPATCSPSQHQERKSPTRSESVSSTADLSLLPSFPQTSTSFTTTKSGGSAGVFIAGSDAKLLEVRKGNEMLGVNHEGEKPIAKTTPFLNIVRKLLACSLLAPADQATLSPADQPLLEISLATCAAVGIAYRAVATGCHTARAAEMRLLVRHFAVALLLTEWIRNYKLSLNISTGIGVTAGGGDDTSDTAAKKRTSDSSDAWCKAAFEASYSRALTDARSFGVELFSLPCQRTHDKHQGRAHREEKEEPTSTLTPAPHADAEESPALGIQRVAERSKSISVFLGSGSQNLMAANPTTLSRQAREEVPTENNDLLIASSCPRYDEERVGASLRAILWLCDQIGIDLPPPSSTNGLHSEFKMWWHTERNEAIELKKCSHCGGNFVDEPNTLFLGCLRVFFPQPPNMKQYEQLPPASQENCAEGGDLTRIWRRYVFSTFASSPPSRKRTNGNSFTPFSDLLLQDVASERRRYNALRAHHGFGDEDALHFALPPFETEGVLGLGNRDDSARGAKQTLKPADDFRTLDSKKSEKYKVSIVAPSPRNGKGAKLAAMVAERHKQPRGIAALSMPIETRKVQDIGKKRNLHSESTLTVPVVSGSNKRKQEHQTLLDRSSSRSMKAKVSSHDEVKKSLEMTRTRSTAAKIEHQKLPDQKSRAPSRTAKGSYVLKGGKSPGKITPAEAEAAIAIVERNEQLRRKDVAVAQLKSFIELVKQRQARAEVIANKWLASLARGSELLESLEGGIALKPEKEEECSSTGSSPLISGKLMKSGAVISHAARGARAQGSPVVHTTSSSLSPSSPTSSKGALSVSSSASPNNPSPGTSPVSERSRKRGLGVRGGPLSADSGGNFRAFAASTSFGPTVATARVARRAGGGSDTHLLSSSSAAEDLSFSGRTTVRLRQAKEKAAVQFALAAKEDRKAQALKDEGSANDNTSYLRQQRNAYAAEESLKLEVFAKEQRLAAENEERELMRSERGGGEAPPPGSSKKIGEASAHTAKINGTLIKRPRGVVPQNNSKSCSEDKKAPECEGGLERERSPLIPKVSARSPRERVAPTVLVPAKEGSEKSEREDNGRTARVTKGTSSSSTSQNDFLSQYNSKPPHPHGPAPDKENALRVQPKLAPVLRARPVVSVSAEQPSTSTASLAPKREEVSPMRDPPLRTYNKAALVQESKGASVCEASNKISKSSGGGRPEAANFHLKPLLPQQATRGLKGGPKGTVGKSTNTVGVPSNNLSVGNDNDENNGLIGDHLSSKKESDAGRTVTEDTQQRGTKVSTLPPLGSTVANAKGVANAFKEVLLSPSTHASHPDQHKRVTQSPPKPKAK